jgi:hypothetical protein
MTSRECFENKWFYMKYRPIGKHFNGEILLAFGGPPAKVYNVFDTVIEL